MLFRSEEELIGGTATDNINPQAINEDIDSLDDILAQVTHQEEMLGE